MRLVVLLFALPLIACSSAVESVPTASPASTQPAVPLLTEPAADGRIFGRAYTVGDMKRLAPITEVKLERGLNADAAEKSGAGRVTPQNLEQLLTEAKPVAPDDKLLGAWNYAPWDRATFISGSRRWSVQLFLGGLGVITDDAGRKGAFRFDAPRIDPSFTDEASILAVSRQDQTDALRTRLLKKELMLPEIINVLTNYRKVSREQYSVYDHQGGARAGLSH